MATYEQYQEIIKTLESMESMTRYKGDSNRMYGAQDIFFIRGTRFCVALYNKDMWSKHYDQDKIIVKWFIKKPRKKYFTEIKFLDILDSSGIIKPSRKTELLFHLDIFS